MFIVDALKRQLHRDIVADPAVHGAVLNLYLNGERFPHRVDYYFPLAAVDDPLLREQMQQHMREEDRHAALYERAIRKLGQPVVQHPIAEIFNDIIRSHTQADFVIRDDDTSATRRLKLAHFFAHLHFLEKRVVHSLEYHADACTHAASPYVGKAIEAILADERRHVTYTRAAVDSLVRRAQARTVLGAHRRAEGRANLDFSARQLGRLVRERAKSFPRGNRLVYLGCARAMQAVVFHG
jgi:hypothetical protein